MTGMTEMLLSFYIFILGMVFGSFGAVVGERVLDKQSIVAPRSHCISCGHVLRALELVPVVAWLALRGKCRNCKVTIPIRYPVFELMVGCGFVLSFWHAHTILQGITSCILWWILEVAVITDLKAMLVPNWLTYTSAPVVYVLAAYSEHAWWGAFIGAVVGFGIVILIHLITGGKMGLGDAKLYLSIGAFLGVTHCIESFVMAAFAGAVIGLLLRVMGGISKRQYIPFVPFIVIGVGVTQFLAFGLPGWYLHTCLGLS